MTDDQRHAYLRIAMAARALADPDTSPRMIRSSRVSLYRGFRALGYACRNDDDLMRACQNLSSYTLRMTGA